MANGGELHLPACAARPAADWLLGKEPPSPRSSLPITTTTHPPLYVGFPLPLSPPASPPPRRSVEEAGGGRGRGRGTAGEGGGEGRGGSLLGIADGEWGGRQAPREAAGRARGLMCLGWAGKWRHENLSCLWAAPAEEAAVWVRRTYRQTDGRTDCPPGGRCQLGTRCGLGCALRGPLGVSEVSRGRAGAAPLDTARRARE